MVEETAMIAAKQFVGALTVKHHLDAVLPGRAEHMILRMDAGRAVGFVLRAQNRLGVVHQRGRADGGGD